MMKYIKWLCCCALTLVCSYSSLATTNTYQNFEYVFDQENWAITITRYSGTNDFIFIPGSLPVQFDGYTENQTVSIIGDSAFSGNGAIKTVVLPEEINTISTNAFNGCSALSTVVFNGYNLPEVMTNAFSGIASGAKGYHNCGENSESIAGLEITQSELIFDGNWAFASFGSFATVVGYKNEMFMQHNPDGGDPDGGGKPDMGPDGEPNFEPENIIFPSQTPTGLPVVGIEQQVFGWQVIAGTITIPETIKFINNGAFSTGEMSGMAPPPTFNFLGDRPSIAQSAFQYWNGEAIFFYPAESTGWPGEPIDMVKIYEAGSVKWISVDEVVYELLSKNGTATVSGSMNPKGHVVIPSEVMDGDETYAVTKVNGRAFGDYEIIAVTIPSSITEIGDSAFNNCQNLSTVLFEGAPPAIHEYAFNSVNAYFPDAMSNAWNSAETSNLNMLPIGERAIITTDLGEVYEVASTSSENPEKRLAELIYVPRNLGGNVVIELTDINSNAYVVTSIRANALRYCEASGVTMPNTITKIGEYAFCAMQNVTNMTISSAVEKIERKTFASMISLESITLPKSMTHIGEDAFYNCPKLMNVVMPGDFPNYRSDSFYETDYRKVLYYPANNASWIDDYGGIKDLYNCGFNQYEKIGTYFVEIDGFKYAIYNNEAELRSAADITGAVLLPDFVDGAPLTSIGEQAFGDKSNISAIIIPASVKTIGDYAFAYCTSLESLFFKGNKPIIGDNAFYQAKAGVSAYVSSGTTGWTIGETIAGDKLSVNNMPDGVEIKTIAFDAQGGETVEPIEYLTGFAYTSLPKTERRGYVFDGWFTDESCSDDSKVDEDSILATGVSTLYANWKTYPVGTALDNSALVFEVSSAMDWYARDCDFYGNADSLALYANGSETGKTTWVQTTVTGPGLLSFDWGSEMEHYCPDGSNGATIDGEYVYFNHTAKHLNEICVEINGVPMGSLFGNSYGLNSHEIYIEAGEHTVKWMLRKNSEDPRLKDDKNGAWLNNVKFQAGVTRPVSYETALLTPESAPLKFFTFGDHQAEICKRDFYNETPKDHNDYYVAFIGIEAHRDGFIETEVVGPGLITFDWNAGFYPSIDCASFMISKGDTTYDTHEYYDMDIPNKYRRWAMWGDIRSNGYSFGSNDWAIYNRGDTSPGNSYRVPAGRHIIRWGIQATPDLPHEWGFGHFVLGNVTWTPDLITTTALPKKPISDEELEKLPISQKKYADVSKWLAEKAGIAENATDEEKLEEINKPSQMLKDESGNPLVDENGDPVIKRDANGKPMSLYQDFLAGTDPEDQDDLLRVEFKLGENGELELIQIPDLNKSTAKKVRKYVTEYKIDLGEEHEWKTVPDGQKAPDEAKFFRVKVMMP